MPHIPSKTDPPPFEEAFQGRHDIPGLESVYKDYVLAAYAAATTEIQRIKLRVLAYLLIWPLNHASLLEVVRSVKRCFDGQSTRSPYERLGELGDFYIRHLICPFKRYHDEENVQEEECPDTADTRRQSLIRDGFRCMISGRVDPDCLKDFPQMNQVLGDDVIEKMETAHIMPVATAEDLENAEKECIDGGAEASVWTVLKSFGYDVLSAVNEEDRLDNLLTLSATMHMEFDSLQLWLEEVPGKLNTYKVYHCRHLSRWIPDEVTFTESNILNQVVTGPGDPELPTAKGPLPLPNPAYLRIHAMYSRIANLSGAAEYLDKIDASMDTTECLSSDGPVAHTFNHASWLGANIVTPV